MEDELQAIFVMTISI